MKTTLAIIFSAVLAASGGLKADSVIGAPLPVILKGLDATASVAYTASGIYVTDDVNNVIQHYDVDGDLIGTISAASQGGVNAALADPSGLQVAATGDLWVADSANDQVLELSPSGAVLATVGAGSGPDSLNDPNAVALGPDSTLYVADSGNDRIAVYDANTGAGNARVSVYDLSGNYQLTIGGRGVGAGGFDSPYGVVVDAQGRVWVADNGGMNVQVFSDSGTFIAGSGAGFDGTDFEDLTGVYVEPDGDVVASDGYANELFVWSKSVAEARPPIKPSTALASAALTVGPVPAQAGQALQLILPAAADRVTWQIFSADMRLQGEVEALGQSHVAYAQTAQLAAGVYLAKVTMEENGIQRQSLQKIIITR
jgi:sugar lactone lactonase YvrE